MAENADSEEARRAHHELANGYAARIAGAKCPRALAGRMIERLSRADTAVQLREQPLSAGWRNERGRQATALAMVAEQFDKDARRIDPLSELR